MRDRNSGKTSLLVAIDEKYQATNGLYLAYNKPIADESQQRFRKEIDCRTTHSLAYVNVINQFKLKIGAFKFYSIKELIEYEEKQLVVSLLEEFSQSKYTTVDDFYKNYQKDKRLDEPPNKSYFDLVKKYFNLMATGKISITFNAMLKFYHIMLFKKRIVHDPFDIIMLDEAGDLNYVTLEIFMLLPSPLKILVGDNRQNIYGFNGTVNGFEILKDQSKILTMTKSFRCSEDVAEGIEIFCKKHLCESVSFEGTDKDDDSEIRTAAFIARNNSSLVAKMISLDEAGIKYNLTREAKSIFELMLFLLFLKRNNKEVYNEDFLHIQEAYDKFSSSDSLKREFKNFFNYAKNEFEDDVNLSAAIGTILAHSRETIFNTYNNAKENEKSKVKHFITLGTAHSTKGKEYDQVELAPDMKRTFLKCLESKAKIGEYTDKDIQELNLIYVAASRAKKKLLSASWMWNEKEQE